MAEETPVLLLPRLVEYLNACCWMTRTLDKISIRLTQAYLNHLNESYQESNTSVSKSHSTVPFVDVFEISSLLYVIKFIRVFDLRLLSKEISKAKSESKEDESDFQLLEYRSFCRFFAKHYFQTFYAQKDQFLRLASYLSLLGSSISDMIDQLSKSLTDFNLDSRFEPLLTALEGPEESRLVLAPSNPYSSKIMSDEMQSQFEESFTPLLIRDVFA